MCTDPQARGQYHVHKSKAEHVNNSFTTTTQCVYIVYNRI